MTSSVEGAINTLGSAERLWWVTVIVCIIALAVMGLVQRFDARLLGGESVWTKPSKFAISIAIHFASIALAVHWLAPSLRLSPAMTALAALSAAAASFEIGYIALQAARAMPSHFNTSSLGYRMLWSLMGFAAVVMLAPMAVVGVLAMTDDTAPWPPAVRTGIALGMAGSALLTLVIGFRIGANMSHFVGVPPGIDRHVALFGWSLHGADLRPSHFLATHMAQAIPLAALVIARPLPGFAGQSVVAALALAWTALTLLIFGNALSGRSLADLLGA